MPEVNEVKAITRELAKNLKSLYIDIGDLSPKRTRYHITNVGSKGKMIYFNLESPKETLFMVSGLGLVGEWIISKTAPKKVNKGFGARLRGVFSLYNSNRSKKPELWLYYMDPLNFGKIKILSENEFRKKLNKLGIDATLISEHQFIDIINDVKTNNAKLSISKFLLSQRWISGVGVYILSEMLYRAKIAPMRKLKTISNADIRRLYSALRWCVDNFIVKMKLVQDLSLSPDQINTWDIINYPFEIYNLSITKHKSKTKNIILKYEVMPGRFVKYSPERQK